MEASRTGMPFKSATADDAPAARGGLTLFGPHPGSDGHLRRSIVYNLAARLPPPASSAGPRRKICGFRTAAKVFVRFLGWMDMPGRDDVTGSGAGGDWLRRIGTGEAKTSRPGAMVKLKIVKTAFSA
jgi:hypothetical protein